MKETKNNKKFDLEKTGVFTDIMSRSERKNYKKMLENGQLNTKNDINIIDKKFEENINEIKKEAEIKDNKKKEKTDKKEIIKQINEKENENKEKISKTNNFVFGKILSVITFLLSIAYLLYSIIFCKNQINNLFLIINSAIIVVTAFFFMLSTIIKNKSIKNIFNIFTSLFISTFLIFNFLTVSNIIEIPTQELLIDFKGKSITEVLKWAKEHNIEIKQIYEYSDNVEEYYVITQDIYPNTLLKNVKEITLTVSYGPNYDKIIALPNMVGWDIDSALKTINDNFLNNVKIEYEINEEEKKDIIYEQNISGQMRRSDELILKVSLGKKEELEQVELINFENKSLFDATLWLKRYAINYEIVYIFSDEIKRDYVVSQEPTKKTKVDPNNDTVKLIVSKGKKIIVPDLTKMTVDEATEWIMTNNLKVKFEETYDSIVEQGKIIKADYKENDEVESGTLITITTSKGQLKMPKFNNLTELRNWANSMGIAYREEYEFNNDIANGNIIKTIPSENAIINYTDTIIVHVSYGAPVTVPSFIGKNKNEIQITCNNVGLNCTFYYNGYSDTPANVAQNQNKNAGSQVVRGTYVSIGLSSGPKPVEQPKPVDPPKPTCDKSITTTVWITPGNDGSQTKANLEKQYKNIKWNFNIVDKCQNGDTTAGAVCNASNIDGQSLNYCDTYTVTIVK